MSFNAGRWAEAYLASCARLGESPSEGLFFLKCVLPLLHKIPGGVPLTYAASHFAELAKQAALQSGTGGITSATALLYLLIKRGHSAKEASLLEAVNRLVDEKNAVIRVTLEIPEQTDDAFIAAFKTALIKKYGANDAKIETKLNPALLGGFRWIVGSVRADYSIKGRLQRMNDIWKV